MGARKVKFSAFVLAMAISTSCSNEGQVQTRNTSDSLVISSIASNNSLLDSTANQDNIDPAQALRTFTSASGAFFSTEVVESSCGLFALIHTSSDTSIVNWVETEWVTADFDTLTNFDPEVRVDKHWIADVTDDENPDIVLNWYADGANRGFGQVLAISENDCIWRYVPIVEGCGSSVSADNLTLVDSDLEISGFVNCKGGRNSAYLLWDSTLRLFVARPLEGDLFCGSLEENIDLPLSSCDESWAVKMAQEALIDLGYSIEADGQFGPATQMAVLRHQQSRGFSLSGQIDGETWASLVTVSASEYPDFDGDGIRSPREIGHVTGATELQ